MTDIKKEIGYCLNQNVVNAQRCSMCMYFSKVDFGHKCGELCRDFEISSKTRHSEWDKTLSGLFDVAVRVLLSKNINAASDACISHLLQAGNFYSISLVFGNNKKRHAEDK